MALSELAEQVLGNVPGWENHSSNGGSAPVNGSAPTLLRTESIGDHKARVAEAPPPQWLFRPVVAEGDYGILAAEPKAGKTWAMADAAVSVASGTPWLGVFDVDSPGPVLLFAGEGGERKVVRRLQAVADARGLNLALLAIRVCLRVPNLTSDAAMALVAEELKAHPPRLIILDPLYLAAGGARGSDLYEMGTHLQRIQVLTQDHNSALLIAHHWNKTGEGRGAKRMSGAGADAWGRILISAVVTARRTDEATKASMVTLELDFQGDEIAETTIRVLRRVWADDPDDLASPLHYEITRVDDDATTTDPALEGLRPAARRVLRVLEAADGWRTVQQIGDALATEGTGRPPLSQRTIQDALAKLAECRLAESERADGSALRWHAQPRTQPEPRTEPEDSGPENAP